VKGTSLRGIYTTYLEMTRDRQPKLVVVEEINGVADVDAHEKNAGGKASK